MRTLPQPIVVVAVIGHTCQRCRCRIARPAADGAGDLSCRVGRPRPCGGPTLLPDGSNEAGRATSAAANANPVLKGLPG